MSVNWSKYSITELKAHFEIDGERAVLKDQARADRLFALLIGPILTWRECKALTKLSDLDCIPNLLHRPTRRAFLMSYHDSEQVTHLNKITPNWPHFFTQLNLAIEEMHNAGVAHNDLRNPTNTLMTPDGKPILVDLVAAFCRGKKWNVVNRWIFNKFCQVDQSAITKLKTKCASHLLTESDLQPEEIAGPTGMAIRRLGQKIRKLSRILFTK